MSMKTLNLLVSKTIISHKNNQTEWASEYNFDNIKTIVTKVLNTAVNGLNDVTKSKLTPDTISLYLEMTFEDWEKKEDMASKLIQRAKMDMDTFIKPVSLVYRRPQQFSHLVKATKGPEVSLYTKAYQIADQHEKVANLFKSRVESGYYLNNLEGQNSAIRLKRYSDESDAIISGNERSKEFKE
ncbi:hypothetical protein PPL_03343 [Heterostelium album PN500]|uniref:Uncharacterized protein n=1 Tax=Heterostelium pallidum (strain ATCC 26659 / Pp 5 / PN500) TaxID=670386 RepID=D3B4L8_HETP5|nr:hypothetical protein PPL_03343 [Heterostelium album PN500]EFA84266.1 hypothetical protein PPL_03343 [Heterostelium album PN500]|eukprot:XP_020436382.1 hypothetical protein PPL_03343 [Heterostelium album PN500]